MLFGACLIKIYFLHGTPVLQVLICFTNRLAATTLTGHSDLLLPKYFTCVLTSDSLSHVKPLYLNVTKNIFCDYGQDWPFIGSSTRIASDSIFTCSHSNILRAGKLLPASF